MSKLSQGGKPQSFTVNSFIFKEQIGAGKFGIVYRAVQKWSEQEVAIKVILKKTINNVSIYKQLKREIQIHSRLKHPNICQLYSYFHDSNSIYLVLEYCPHGNLSIPIREQKQRLSQKKIASIFFQLVQAVDYMHKRNVMHRDLKLENILVDSNFNVKIADFGWCIHVSRQRKTLCGTLQYMSPQMLKEEPYRHNIDVYCLGIILYELFFQKTPFVTNEHITTLKNIADGLFSFDDSFRIISDQAKDLISLMLSKDKDKRPAPSSLLEHPFIKTTLSQRSQQKLDLEKLLTIEMVSNLIVESKQQQDELKAKQILKQIQEINEIEDGQQQIQENVVVQTKIRYQLLNQSAVEDYGQIIYPEI